MTRHLLDVSVLLALAWPRHESHAAAQAWFMKSGQHAWATNPVTQLGLLRLLTNPAVSGDALSAPAALRVLSAAASHAGHEFWPLERDMPAALNSIAARVKGHRQWTDALLLSHARERRGIFVTFDAGVQALASGELKDHLLVLRRS